MKKVLIIAIGMLAFELSAMSLPGNYEIVQKDDSLLKFAPTELYSDVVLFSENQIITDVVFENTITSKISGFQYMASKTIIDLALVYHPIFYENDYGSVSYVAYDFYKTKGKHEFKNTFDNMHRICYETRVSGILI